MNTTRRYILVILGLLVSLHFIAVVSRDDYRRATSFSNIASHWKKPAGPIPDSSEFSGLDAEVASEDAPSVQHHDLFGQSGSSPKEDGTSGSQEASNLNLGRKANATFVILARNSDLDGVIQSVTEIERRFNKRHQYPYVFLNEEVFDAEFKRRVVSLTDARIEFGQIPREHWFQPDWVDEDKASEARNSLVRQNVVYGGSVSYRNMCRFNSGFFYRHKLLQKYRWYWRIEPSVHFHCNINFDPFLFLEDHGKVYSFTLTVYEIPQTIKTLWQEVKRFTEQNRHLISNENSLGFISHNGGETYNRCHFWSNFEIADMDFWRAPAYTAFFDHLDKTGGFYYERWGDAPVHSIAVSLLARRDQIHFFDEIGYQHDSWTHCPKDKKAWEDGQCDCDQKGSFDYSPDSCKAIWDRFRSEHPAHGTG